MDYLAAIGKAAALPAKLAWRLATLGEEDFEYESRTSLLPEPRMPEFRTDRPTWITQVGVPDAEQVNIVIRLPLHLVRDATEPDEVQTVVAYQASSAYGRFREALRERRD